mmetsp:Transcript_4351/g.12362  ORF Transcript_4351/g.12362 Transcript_4351/m.12362 type:complete len:215 (-) Transcript_4351:468-1112(-)
MFSTKDLLLLTMLMIIRENTYGKHNTRRSVGRTNRPQNMRFPYNSRTHGTMRSARAHRNSFKNLKNLETLMYEMSVCTVSLPVAISSIAMAKKRGIKMTSSVFTTQSGPKKNWMRDITRRRNNSTRNHTQKHKSTRLNTKVLSAVSMRRAPTSMLTDITKMLIMMTAAQIASNSMEQITLAKQLPGATGSKTLLVERPPDHRDKDFCTPPFKFV